MIPPSSAASESEGVFREAKLEKFFKIHHTSTPASEVSSFETTLPRNAVTFTTQKKEISIPRIFFGSMAVDETAISDDDLKRLTNEECVKIIHTGFIINDIPELWINKSLHLQLKKYLKDKGYSVETQRIDHDNTVLPYNKYYKSIPDLVISKEKKILAVSSIEPDIANEEDTTLVSEI